MTLRLPTSIAQWMVRPGSTVSGRAGSGRQDMGATAGAGGAVSIAAGALGAGSGAAPFSGRQPPRSKDQPSIHPVTHP